MTRRLGGEFHELGDAKPTRLEWEARQAFLQAVRKHVPNVLESLRSDVFPRYMEARPVPSALFYMQTERNDFLNRLLGKALNPLLPPKPLSPQYESLRAGLFDWAERFHLTDRDAPVEWVLDTALDTMVRWQHSPSTEEAWGLPPDYFFERLVSWPIGRDFSHVPAGEFIEYEVHHQYEPDAFTFRQLGWTCYAEQRSEYEQRAIEGFRVELAKYLDAIEREAEERGWKRTPERRGRKVEPSLSFDMLARWQCGAAQSKKRLAIEYGLSRDSLVERLEQAANLVQITLRAGRRGRPRKPRL